MIVGFFDCLVGLMVMNFVVWLYGFDEKEDGSIVDV